MFIVVHIDVEDPPECLGSHLELARNGAVNDVVDALVINPTGRLAYCNLCLHYLLGHLIEEEGEDLGVSYLAVEGADFVNSARSHFWGDVLEVADIAEELLRCLHQED